MGGIERTAIVRVLRSGCCWSERNVARVYIIGASLVRRDYPWLRSHFKPDLVLALLPGQTTFAFLNNLLIIT
jgi:hypothetical protein